ncbi:pentapeptide repeat-containing protein [Streptomyces sp. NPDC001493]
MCLRGACLRNARLRGAYLRNGRLRGARLRGARLRNGRLRDVPLRNGRLRDRRRSLVPARRPFPRCACDPLCTTWKQQGRRSVSA